MRFCKGHSCEYSLRYSLFYLNAVRRELCFCCGLLVEDDSSYETKYENYLGGNSAI